MQRLPRDWAGSQPDLESSVTKEREPHDAVTVREKSILADFCSGPTESSMRCTRANVVARRREAGAEHCVINVRWSRAASEHGRRELITYR